MFVLFVSDLCLEQSAATGPTITQIVHYERVSGRGYGVMLLVYVWLLVRWLGVQT